MKKITGKTIFNQLKYDLIGKDSQRGITLTYGWLANQFGHLALGFIPTVLFNLIYTTYFPCVCAKIWAPLTTAIIWTCFEAYNFLVPLLKQKGSYVFEPDWKNVGFDTATDLQYFYFGAFSAALVYSQCLWIQITFYALLVIIAVLFRVWYPVKMYMQYAQFPFQFRISQWFGSIKDEDKNAILNIVENKEQKHILIFGNESSGKTSLGVGIATEFSIKRSIAFYTTGIKFTGLLQNSDEDLQKKFDLEWSWRDAEILVIDDIDSGGNNEDVITPDFFETANNNSLYSKQNIEALKTKATIWVVGKYSNKDKWEKFLTNTIGVSSNKIFPIKL